MNGKKWYWSMTFWSAVLTAVGVGLQMVWGVEFTAAEQTTVLDGLSKGMEVVGLIGVVIGRWKARGPLMA